MTDREWRTKIGLWLREAGVIAFCLLLMVVASSAAENSGMRGDAAGLVPVVLRSDGREPSKNHSATISPVPPNPACAGHIDYL